MFSQFFRKFAVNEAGAVTVDWVVLTAAVLALVALAVSAIQGGTLTLAASLFP